MVTTPTGVLWPSFAPEDSTRIRKWLYGSVLVRDWDAAGTTNMNNIPVFSANGNLNPALLLPVSQGGYGFYDVGNITEAGVEFTPQFSADETYVWQSRKSQRTDITKDDEEVMFSCADSTPLTDYLYYNLPIGFTGVPLFPSIGASGYTVTKPFYSDVVYRQLLIIGVDGSVGPGGQPEYIIELRPRVSLSKKAKKQWTSKSVDVTELTYTCHVDPFSGYDMQTLRGGIVWLDEGGPVTLPQGVANTSQPAVNTALITTPTNFAQTPSASGGTLAAGTYYWVMTAITALGETTRSSELTSTTTGSTSSNVLTWTAVTGATGYKIYRGVAPGAETVLVTTIGSGGTVTYTDTGSAGTAFSPPGTNTACIAVPGGVSATGSTTGGNLPAGQNYWVVTALTAAGETNASAEVNAVLTTANSSATVSWSAATGATGYKVYRGTSAGAENYLVTLPSTSTTSFIDRGATVVGTANGASSLKATLVFNQPPLPQQGFTYTVTQQVGGSGPFASSSIFTTSTNATTGVVTIVVQSLANASTYVFSVTATAANGLSATYPNSNSITAS